VRAEHPKKTLASIFKMSPPSIIAGARFIQKLYNSPLEPVFGFAENL
jgi:hypothetical protein